MNSKQPTRLEWFDQRTSVLRKVLQDWDYSHTPSGADAQFGEPYSPPIKIPLRHFVRINPLVFWERIRLVNLGWIDYGVQPVRTGGFRASCQSRYWMHDIKRTVYVSKHIHWGPIRKRRDLALRDSHRRFVLEEDMNLKWKSYDRIPKLPTNCCPPTHSAIMDVARAQDRIAQELWPVQYSFIRRIAEVTTSEKRQKLRRTQNPQAYSLEIQRVGLFPNDTLIAIEDYETALATFKMRPNPDELRIAWHLAGGWIYLGYMFMYAEQRADLVRMRTGCRDVTTEALEMVRSRLRLPVMLYMGRKPREALLF